MNPLHQLPMQVTSKPGSYAIVKCGEKHYVGMVMAVEGLFCKVEYMKPSHTGGKHIHIFY